MFAAAGMALNVAQCEQDIARVHIVLRQAAAAEALLASAQQAFRAQGADHLLANSLVYMADVRQLQGRLAEANDLLAQARAMYARRGLSGHAALCYLRLAEVDLAAGQCPAAIAGCLAARAIFTAQQWPLYVALSELSLGEAHLALGQVDAAIEWLQRSLAKVATDFPRYTSLVYARLAHCHRARATSRKRWPAGTRRSTLPHERGHRLCYGQWQLCSRVRDALPGGHRSGRTTACRYRPARICRSEQSPDLSRGHLSPAAGCARSLERRTPALAGRASPGMPGSHRAVGEWTQSADSALARDAGGGGASW